MANMEAKDYVENILGSSQLQCAVDNFESQQIQERQTEVSEVRSIKLNYILL
jgi:hypothetical protein